MRYLIVILFVAICGTGDFLSGQESLLGVDNFKDSSDARVNLISTLQRRLVVEELALNNSQRFTLQSLSQQLLEEKGNAIDAASLPMLSLSVKAQMTSGEIERWRRKRRENINEICSPINEQFHQRALELLLPEQKARLAELSALNKLSGQKIFSEYQNAKLKEKASIETNEFEKLSSAVDRVRDDFVDSVNKQLRRFHNEIQNVLDDESAERFSHLLGEPIELPEEAFSSFKIK